jgi:hypothetical protein
LILLYVDTEGVEEEDGAWEGFLVKLETLALVFE